MALYTSYWVQWTKQLTRESWCNWVLLICVWEWFCQEWPSFMILCLLTETLPKLKRWKVQYKFGVFLDSTVRMILRDNSSARVEFKEDREASEIIEEESLQLEMELAIKWWMSVYLNQKMRTFGMMLIYYFLTFQPTNLNDILIYDKLYSAQSTSISCLHLKPSL